MSIGDYRHSVIFENPGGTTPDGDGGFTQTWTPFASWHASIAPASPQDLERFAAGSVITQTTNIVRARFHPDVSTATRMIHKGRTLAIVGARDVDERGITMELLAVEQEQAGP